MNRTLMATASALALLVGVPATLAQTTQGQPATPRTQQNQPATQGGSGSGTNTTMPQNTTGTAGGAATTQQAGQVDTQRLIGRNVVNAQNETVGEIESLLVDQDGKVRSAIIGVGGFLGIGERHVAVNWDQLAVAQNGDRVTINMSRDQLRGLPEFRYSETQRRGSMFTDTGPYTRAPGAPAGTMSGSGDTRGTVGGSTGAANAPGGGTMAMNTQGAAGTPLTGDQAMSASNLIGLNLRNTANESIGEVKDVILGADGKVREVIVGVGGFLGMGERYVAISWDQLKMSRTGDNRFMGQVGYTRDQLRELPVWRQDRNTGWTRG